MVPRSQYQSSPMFGKSKQIHISSSLLHVELNATRRRCLEDLGLSPFLKKLSGREVRRILAVNEN